MSNCEKNHYFFFLYKFQGFQTADPPLAKYLMVGFEISSTYAERFLYHLLHLNIIEYQPEFQVKIENARTIFEGCKMPMIVYTDEPAEKPASANRTSIHLNTPDAEALSAAQVPSRPTPSFTSQDQICLWGNSPSSSIKLTQETF